MEARVGVAPTLTGLQPVTRNSRNRPCEEEVGVDPKPITGPSRFRDGVTRRGESSSRVLAFMCSYAVTVTANEITLGKFLHHCLQAAEAWELTRVATLLSSAWTVIVVHDIVRVELVAVHTRSRFLQSPEFTLECVAEILDYLSPSYLVLLVVGVGVRLAVSGHEPQRRFGRRTPVYKTGAFPTKLLGH